MTRITLSLGIALLLSLGVNLFQLISYVKHSTAEPLKQQIAAFEQTSAINNAVAHQRVVDDGVMAKAVANASRVEIKTLTRYKTRIVKLPAPTCAPGAERVATWNTFATPTKADPHDSTVDPAAAVPAADGLWPRGTAERSARVLQCDLSHTMQYAIAGVDTCRPRLP